MSTITADPPMLLVLSQMNDVTAIRDADGKIVGIFTPGVSEESLLIEAAKRVVDFKELDRRKRKESGQGLPTSEVLNRMNAVLQIVHMTP